MALDRTAAPELLHLIADLLNARSDDALEDVFGRGADHEVREVVQRYERRIWDALSTLTAPST
jgi:hypothetical protein